MPRQHWLVKQEPSTYSWEDLVREGQTPWTGVRNFQARNNLRSMRKGDLVLFYHSGEGKEIVGLAKVSKEAYPDPTAEEGDWSCVDVAPVKPLAKRVSLTTIKGHAGLKGLQLVTHSRLSVMPVTETDFGVLMGLAETKEPKR